MKLNKFTQTITSIAVATTLTFSITNKAQAGVFGGSLTGNYNVGKSSYNFTDYSRKEIYTADDTDYRELNVQFFYPTKNVPSAASAPYINTPVANKIGETFNIPILGDLFNSVQINSIPQATIANDQSKYPVLFFSHGLKELPEFYTSFVEQLASNGYIVATMSHSYDALATELAGGKVVGMADNSIFAELGNIDPEKNPEQYISKQNEISAQATQIRAADARFLLNELSKINSNDSQNLLTSKLDLDNIGIFGHSMGGATAAEAMRLDSRFKAGINMDGTLWSDVANTGLDRPFMLMNGGNSLETDQNMKQFYDNLKGDKYNLNIKNAKHQDFSDKPLLKAENPILSEIIDGLNPGEFGTNDPNVNNKIINDYTLDFFNKYLKNQDAPLLKNKLENSDIKFTSATKSVPEPRIPVGLMGMFGLWFFIHPLRRSSKM